MDAFDIFPFWQTKQHDAVSNITPRRRHEQKRHLLGCSSRSAGLAIRGPASYRAIKPGVRRNCDSGVHKLAAVSLGSVPHGLQP